MGGWKWYQLKCRPHIPIQLLYKPQVYFAPFSHNTQCGRQTDSAIRIGHRCTSISVQMIQKYLISFFLWKKKPLSVWGTWALPMPHPGPSVSQTPGTAPHPPNFVFWQCVMYRFLMLFKHSNCTFSTHSDMQYYLIFSISRVIGFKGKTKHGADSSQNSTVCLKLTMIISYNRRIAQESFVTIPQQRVRQMLQMILGWHFNQYTMASDQLHNKCNKGNAQNAEPHLTSCYNTRLCSTKLTWLGIRNYKQEINKQSFLNWDLILHILLKFCTAYFNNSKCILTDAEVRNLDSLFFGEKKTTVSER